LMSIGDAVSIPGANSFHIWVGTNALTASLLR
jgi:hypothetical protein